jgi:TPR repeat protein
LASEKGDILANNMLADLYFNGKYVNKNFEKSFLYYKKNELNNPLAQNNLAYMYENGIGCQKDI